MKIVKYDFVPGLYSAVIFAAALAPIKSTGLDFKHSDKLLHAVAFAVLGVILSLSARKHILWPGIAWLAACAAGSELIQGLVPHREFNWLDMAADMIGGLPVFLGMMWFIQRRRRKKQARQSQLSAEA